MTRKFRVHWTVPITLEVEAETPESAKRISAAVSWIPNGDYVKFWPSPPVKNWSMGFPIAEPFIEEVSDDNTRTDANRERTGAGDALRHG